jgi:hypothetical protein
MSERSMKEDLDSSSVKFSIKIGGRVHFADLGRDPDEI